MSRPRSGIGGGVAALVRGSGLLEGHTDSGAEATAPANLLIEFTVFDSEFVVEVTINGTTYALTASSTDPANGSIWLDSSGWGSPSDAAGALATALIALSIGEVSINAPSGYQIEIVNAVTGAGAGTTASVYNHDGAGVTGGGYGVDAVPPSGAVEEVELIAIDGTKTIKPVKAGVSTEDPLGVAVQLALKVAGVYYPIADDINATSGEVVVGTFFAEWIAGRASASLVARITGTVPVGGSLTCWAIAEQV